MFVRADFLLPSCTNDVGPSAATFFHGGEGGLDDLGVVDLLIESNLRFFPPCTSPSASSSVWISATAESGSAVPLERVPLLKTVGSGGRE